MRKLKESFGSVIAQEYHVMFQEGLEYPYVTNGLASILLRVPYDDPGLCITISANRTWK